MVKSEDFQGLNLRAGLRDQLEGYQRKTDQLVKRGLYPCDRIEASNSLEEVEHIQSSLKGLSKLIGVNLGTENFNPETLKCARALISGYGNEAYNRTEQISDLLDRFSYYSEKNDGRSMSKTVGRLYGLSASMGISTRTMRDEIQKIAEKQYKKQKSNKRR